jgi:pimeloyl-ACP methyl ester carboxylesterase
MLHYVETGAGEPIIFIHGSLSDYTKWLPQFEPFSNRGHRVIAYSRRYNFPNENPIQPNHSASVEAEDLAAFMDELRIPKAHIVGHSYGAYTALILGLRHPELVLTLTLAEPPIASWLENLPAPSSQAGREHYAKLMNEFVNPAKAAFAAGDNDLGLQKLLDFVAGKGAWDRLPDASKAVCRRNVNELRALVQSDGRYPVVDRGDVRRLQVPTLMLSGSKTEDVAKLTDAVLHELLPRDSHRWVVLPEATHLMWTQQPHECREAVLQFIHQQ